MQYSTTHSPPVGDTEMLQPPGTESSVMSTTSGNQVQCNSDPLPEWQVVRSAKRKRRNSGGIATALQVSNTSEIKQSNRFEALQSAENNSNSSEELQQVNGTTENTPQTKPPPIFIPNVINVPSFTQSLPEGIEENTFTYKMCNNEVKVNPETIESYRAIIKFLNEKRQCTTRINLKKREHFV